MRSTYRLQKAVRWLRDADARGAVDLGEEIGDRPSTRFRSGRSSCTPVRQSESEHALLAGGSNHTHPAPRVGRTPEPAVLFRCHRLLRWKFKKYLDAAEPEEEHPSVRVTRHLFFF